MGIDHLWRGHLLRIDNWERTEGEESIYNRKNELQSIFEVGVKEAKAYGSWAYDV